MKSFRFRRSKENSKDFSKLSEDEIRVELRKSRIGNWVSAIFLILSASQLVSSLLKMGRGEPSATGAWIVVVIFSAWSLSKYSKNIKEINAVSGRSISVWRRIFYWVLIIVVIFLAMVLLAPSIPNE